MYRYGPTWSPDSKKLLYWDKMHRLWWISTEEKRPVQVDQGDYGDITDGSWAPDSQWIAYSKADRRGAGQLFLYSLDQKKTTKVSDGFYNDTNPIFDREGKYLFFFSQRYFFPSIGQLDQRFNYYSTDGIFALTLKADEASPSSRKATKKKPTKIKIRIRKTKKTRRATTRKLMQVERRAEERRSQERGEEGRASQARAGRFERHCDARGAPADPFGNLRQPGRAKASSSTLRSRKNRGRSVRSRTERPRSCCTFTTSRNAKTKKFFQVLRATSR